RSENGRKIRVQKPERVRRPDHSNSFPSLRVNNLFMQLYHLGPVHFRSEMMLSVIAVVEPQQIVPFRVGTDTPCDRLIRIATHNEERNHSGTCSTAPDNRMAGRRTKTSSSERSQW